MKKIKEMLLNMGYRLEKSSKTELKTKITNEYYIKDDKCIRFLKVGKSRVIITIYTEWNKKVHNAGKDLKYDASVQEVEDFIQNH